MTTPEMRQAELRSFVILLFGQIEPIWRILKCVAGGLFFTALMAAVFSFPFWIVYVVSGGGLASGMENAGIFVSVLGSVVGAIMFLVALDERSNRKEKGTWPIDSR